MMSAVKLFVFLLIVGLQSTIYGKQVDETQSSSDDVSSRLSALEQTVTDLKEEISSLKTQNEHMQYHAAIPNDSIRGKRQAIDQVAFTVGVSKADLTNLGAHQTIIFDSAISNIGNAYHTTTGVFTAPVHGVYSFTLTFMVSPGKSAYLQIVAGGRNINNIYAASPAGGSHVSTTKQWILELNKGEEVWIRNTNADDDIHGSWHTIFSGFLLFGIE